MGGKYLEAAIEQTPCLIFTFVRVDGTVLTALLVTSRLNIFISCCLFVYIIIELQNYNIDIKMVIFLPEIIDINVKYIFI